MRTLVEMGGTAGASSHNRQSHADQGQPDRGEVHGLAVATRNRADFENAGVRIVDPSVG
jgi:hypothetical protein